MQAGTRDALSCMDRHKLTGPHGHISVPLVKFDMGHYFRRGPYVQSKSHSYSLIHVLFLVLIYCVYMSYITRIKNTK